VTFTHRLVALGTATLGEAAQDARIPKAQLRPVRPGMRLAGPARTVRCLHGDNLALHLAIDRARTGDVLVVDYGENIDSGPFGELMALACQMRGVAGLVIDGAVRDSDQIAAMGFPVFSRGLNIRGTTKLNRGELDINLKIGGVMIYPGDMIVADSDGVVVLPASSVKEGLLAGEMRVVNEKRMMRRLRSGEPALQVFGLGRGDTS
jgi:4-hydroxy-4-methyl-2-oxoglutarate aldolase